MNESIKETYSDIHNILYLIWKITRETHYILFCSQGEIEIVVGHRLLTGQNLINYYNDLCKSQKAIIVGRYRNSKVSLNTLIGINCLYDNYRFSYR
jgi:hypothetical protein